MLSTIYNLIIKAASLPESGFCILRRRDALLGRLYTKSRFKWSVFQAQKKRLSPLRTASLCKS